MAGDTGEPGDDGIQGVRGRSETSRPRAGDASNSGGETRRQGGIGAAGKGQRKQAKKRYGDTKTVIRTPLYDKSGWSRLLLEADAKWRAPIRRDWARVIHSPSFRRLQGKTQVFPGHESDFFRNRLTHSLEVAQIAEGIAERINHFHPDFKEDPINERLCATAALLHDLGHPPFGHNGERALDDVMKHFGGFEGNAQTIRIITKLEKKVRQEWADDSNAVEDSLGLNLTRRTIASVLKYDNLIPGVRESDDKLVKGYYASETDIIEDIKSTIDPEWPINEIESDYKFKTIECYIMDIADDIAYSTYDLEDCFKAGFLTPGKILASSEDLLERVAAKVSKALKRDFYAFEVMDVFMSIFDSVIVEKSNLNHLQDTLFEFGRLYKIFSNIAENGYDRTALSSQLVNDAIRSVKVKYNSKIPALSKAALSDDMLVKVEVLKQYTYESTIYSARVKVAEFRGYEVVKGIFKALTDDKGFLLMPDDLRQEYLLTKDNATARMRAICDFIAGMTDRYALEFYGRLHSDTAQSIFKQM